MDDVTSNFAEGVPVGVMQVGAASVEAMQENYFPQDEPAEATGEDSDDLAVHCPKCHSTEVIFDQLVDEPGKGGEVPRRSFSGHAIRAAMNGKMTARRRRGEERCGSLPMASDCRSFVAGWRTGWPAAINGRPSHENHGVVQRDRKSKSPPSRDERGEGGAPDSFLSFFLILLSANRDSTSLIPSRSPEKGIDNSRSLAELYSAQDEVHLLALV